ncbi:sodium-dependent transporter [Coralloluteibacterium stylophorae]|uniref:Transporter n=1 Tax=Coralloluteibacterium stylophorae TaxID=1776034 RepID=A0A8J7VY26_9GAMM|nr:sodium-dependent transporter [Coralloluteibacterium stylophorae]MBS7457544.1 sodium-dependent transporter [Coralloluteibacterium stylophorae]
MSNSQWASRLGFILAAAGSAVGLGAIWKFPYVAGQNGGGAFLLLTFALIFSLGLCLLLVEMAIGRAAQRGALRAFAALGPRGWSLLGWWGVVGGFVLFSFYSVVGGWTLAYVLKAFDGSIVTTDGERLGAIFGAFTADPVHSVAALAAFVGLTLAVVLGGVQKGIEAASKVLMPLLFLLMLVLIVRGLTLPGAAQGLRSFLAPDFGALHAAVVIDALGLALFSLSTGIGAMLVYGSYVGPEIDLPRSAAWVVALTTLASVLGGLMVLPPVFALGMSPAQGPGLSYMVMPAVFAFLPAGQVFAVLFFVLLAVAALTSSISMLELVAASLGDRFGWRRGPVSIAVAVLVLLAGTPAALSFGIWNGWRIGGRTLFEAMDYLVSNIMLPLGGAGIALFACWVAWPQVRRALGAAEGAADGAGLRAVRIVAGIVAPAIILALWVANLRG